MAAAELLAMPGLLAAPVQHLGVQALAVPVVHLSAGVRYVAHAEAPGLARLSVSSVPVVPAVPPAGTGRLALAAPQQALPRTGSAAQSGLAVEPVAQIVQRVLLASARCPALSGCGTTTATRRSGY